MRKLQLQLISWLFATPFLLAQEPAPAAARLILVSDFAASLEIDGKPVGTIQPRVPIQIETAPGDHHIVAAPISGGLSWSKSVQVSSAFPTSVTIPLGAHLDRIEVQKQGYWKDERTNLIWAAADNGSGVTVSQARTYCRQLSAGGFHDWRLPAIDELQPLFGGPVDERGLRVIPPLKLTGWAWSATQGNEPAENWTLDFGDGARASVAAGDAGLNRALCVRSAPASREHAFTLHTQ